MNTERNLRALRRLSMAVTAFALLLAAAGMVQIGLGGIAVSEEYERIEEIEELTRQRTIYGYRARQLALEAEYRRSSTAFFLEGRFMPSDDELSFDDPAVLTGIASLLAAFGFLAAAIAWVWRAHRNLTEAGMRPKFTAGKAVAGYLLPFVNFIVPFEAMRELYNRSHNEPEEFVDSTVEDVTAWYTAMVTGLLIFSAMTIKFALDYYTNLIIMTPLWMEFAIVAFALILLLGAAYLFSSLARRITAAQEEHLADMAEHVPVEDTKPRMSVNVLQS